MIAEPQIFKGLVNKLNPDKLIPLFERQTLMNTNKTQLAVGE